MQHAGQDSPVNNAPATRTDGSTARKLWLGFGVLTGLLIASSLIIITRVWSIQTQMSDMVQANNLSVATRQIETNLLGYALSLRTYVQNGGAEPLRDAVQQAAAATQAQAAYRRLSTSEQQREMAARFAPLWRDLQQAGQPVLAGNRLFSAEDSARFYELRITLEQLLDEEMQVDAATLYNARRDAAVRDAKAVLGFALLLLVAGVLLAVGTSIVVGRAVLKTEESLKQSHNEMENRVRERTAELDTSNLSLRRSNQELEQFASVASHDLQEPLRKIQAFGDRLKEKCSQELGAQGHDYLERILVSAARMRTLINDLLSFSRVTTKAQPFVATKLAALAREALSDLEGRLQQTSGQVEIGKLPTVDVDPSQMRQVFLNLIGNGLKYHRPDVPPVVSVRGRVLPEPRMGRSGLAETCCEIAVEDNGIGFEETYLDRIFEVFQRLHGRNEFEGTGMGLAICRKIVERHGGQITAKSTPGQGSIFLVTLPIHQLTEEATS